MTFPGLTHAQKTTAQLLEQCTDFDKVVANNMQPQNAAEAINFGLCMGYFEGFTDGIAINKSYSVVADAAGKTSLSVTAEELVFKLYVNRHPESKSQEAVLSVLSALLDANIIIPKKASVILTVPPQHNAVASREQLWVKPSPNQSS
jgi:hypothetical protein